MRGVIIVPEMVVVVLPGVVEGVAFLNAAVSNNQQSPNDITSEHKYNRIRRCYLRNQKYQSKRTLGANDRTIKAIRSPCSTTRVWGRG